MNRMDTLCLSALAILFFIPLLTGCKGVVPPEIGTATVAQEKALDTLIAGYNVVVEAYDKECRTTMRKFLNARFAEEMRKASIVSTEETTGPDGTTTTQILRTVPEAEVTRLVQQRDEAWDTYISLMDAKKEEFLDNEAMLKLKQLNMAIQRWVRATAVDTVLPVQELTKEVLDLLGIENELPSSDQ